MAINRAMRAALKALSYADNIDIKKTYRAERQIKTLGSIFAPMPEGYSIWDRAILRGDHVIPVRIYAPPDNLKSQVLLFFHGGGWVTGNIDSYNRVCIDMAHLTGYTVASVDYRLAPEYPFPIGLEDCYAVAESLHRMGLTAQNGAITLIGDSAGGNIAAAVSLMARDRGEFLPRKQILIYPATAPDHSYASPFPSLHENGKGYLLTAKRIRDYLSLYISDEKDFQSPYFAPLLARSLSNQPKTLIITAEYCPLRDEGEYYGERLREAGGTVEIHRLKDALHGFFSLPTRFDHVREAYHIINRFLIEE